MEWLGYIVTILVGVALGLIGGGGSIFTIPVLVYLFQVPALEATSYSHFLVGITALMATISSLKNKMIHYKSALFFGIPSIISVFLSRVWLLPQFPNTFHLLGYNVSENLFILLLFSVMMIVASYSMIRKCETCTKDGDDSQIKLNISLLIISGFSVGILTGIVGAGGGFLIIPALVFLGKLPMKKAIATSLFIISIKSLIGFGSEIGQMYFDWELLITVTGLSVMGMLLGQFLNKKMNGENLKPIFGWFILAMGIFMLIVELQEVIK